VGNKGSMNEADKTFEKLDYVSIFIHATTGIHRIVFAVRTDNSMELKLKKILLYCRHHYEEFDDSISCFLWILFSSDAKFHLFSA